MPASDAKYYVPEGEWDISYQLRLPIKDGLQEEKPLIQGAIRIVDSQRHNIKYLLQQSIEEKYAMLPQKLKRRLKKGK